MQLLQRIDENPCSDEKQNALLNLLIDSNSKIEDQIMSKQAAADYLGISRATFDKKVHDGLLPKGHKYSNLKELIWIKEEIDLYLIDL